jgi:two-component system CheB/CheR fusion protein
MITGRSDIRIAVEAMKAGAVDFVEKPVGYRQLLAHIEIALEQSRDWSKRIASRNAAVDKLAGLTPRDRQVIELVLAGHSRKSIAARLAIARRTVEEHRVAIRQKTGVTSVPELARLAFAAGWENVDALPNGRY